MYTQNRLFPPHVTRISGQASRISFTVQCHKCGKTQSIGGPRVLPDDAVYSKFKDRGWLLGQRSRAHDICPACLGVTPENRLARRFKVVKGGRELPSPAEVAEQAFERRIASKADAKAALDRLFSPPDASASNRPSRVPEPATEPILSGKRAEAAMPDTATTHTTAILLNDVSEIRAGIELLVEQASQRNAISEKALGMRQDTLVMWQRCMDMLAEQRQQQEQITRAVLALIPVITEQTHDLGERVREVLAAITPAPRPPADGIGSPLLQAETAIVCESETALAERPEDDSAAQDAAETSERACFALVRLRSEAVVTSYRYRNRDAYQTTVSLERSVWEQAGFSPADRYAILRDESGCITIRRASKGGYAAKHIGPRRVTLQTLSLGDLAYTRRHVTVGPGEIRV